MRLLLFLLTLVLLTGCSAMSSPRAALVEGARIVQYDPALAQLIAGDAVIEEIASGFAWAEGPVWSPELGAVLFNDVPANTMHSWSAAEGLNIFLRPSGRAGDDPQHVFREAGANGMFRGVPGTLLLADSGSRSIARLDLATKQETVLADRFEGKRFNSPNDLVRRHDGVVFFTDPPYGLEGLDESPAKEQVHNGVYRLDTDGTVTPLDGSLGFPNGIALSPDESTLYVSNSDPKRPIWMRYALNATGDVVDRSVFADGADLLAAGAQGLPDGMAIAAGGQLFAAGPGGVIVFDSTGKRLGRIEAGRVVSNCAFGDNGKTLYMTATDRVLRVAVRVRGLGF